MFLTVNYMTTPKRDIICQTWFCSYLDEDSKSKFKEIARKLETVSFISSSDKSLIPQ